MAGSVRRTVQTQGPALSNPAVTNVSHELRTPLNGIIGMAELLSGTPLTPEQRSYVEAIRGSGAALASLVDEMLDHARIAAGRLDIVEAAFEVTPLIESVAELLAPRAQGRGLEIAVSIAPDVSASLVGDASRIRQILLNVVGNAVKFTDAGGVGIEATVVAGALRIAVADTGPGVPAARQAAIFEAFEQAAPSTAQHFGGTGLGLAIGRQLAARMGGTLQLAASGPAGSTFVLMLPLRGAVPGAAPIASHGDRRALIVANSPFEAPAMAARLREVGMTVDIVADVAAAEARLDGVYLLIVDCAQGEAPARTLARKARAAGVGRRLVLFSPFERRAFGRQSMRAFDGWLVKPVRARSLYARLAAPAEASGPHLAPAPFAVLLAEDNEINALLATRYLEKLGATVTRVADGAAAVDLLGAALEGKRPRFDLAVLDLRMPKLNGFEVAQRLRTLEAVNGTPPLHVIALSADRLDGRAAAAFDQVLAKPVELRQLARVLEACRALPLRATG